MQSFVKGFIENPEGHVSTQDDPFRDLSIKKPGLQYSHSLDDGPLQD